MGNSYNCSCTIHRRHSDYAFGAASPLVSWKAFRLVPLPVRCSVRRLMVGHSLHDIHAAVVPNKVAACHNPAAESVVASTLLNRPSLPAVMAVLVPPLAYPVELQAIRTAVNRGHQNAVAARQEIQAAAPCSDATPAAEAEATVAGPCQDANLAVATEAACRAATHAAALAAGPCPDAILAAAVSHKASAVGQQHSAAHSANYDLPRNRF